MTSSKHQGIVFGAALTWISPSPLFQLKPRPLPLSRAPPFPWPLNTKKRLEASAKVFFSSDLRTTIGNALTLSKQHPAKKGTFQNCTFCSQDRYPLLCFSQSRRSPKTCVFCWLFFFSQGRGVSNCCPQIPKTWWTFRLSLSCSRARGMEEACEAGGGVGVLVEHGGLYGLIGRSSGAHIVSNWSQVQ